MKPLVFIISIIFLCLAVFPCHCIESHVNTLSCYNEQQKSKRGSDHDHEHLADDNCTPFCACSSFHNPSIIIECKTVLANETKPVKHTALYDYTEITTHPESLWRPPQA